MSKIEFMTASDQFQLRGPKVDKSYTLAINVPEYERGKLAPLLMLEDCNLKITIEDK